MSDCCGAAAQKSQFRGRITANSINALAPRTRGRKWVSCVLGALSCLWLALLLLGSKVAHADFPPAHLYFIENIPGTYPTPQEACEAFAPRALEGQSPREILGVIGVWANNGCAITTKLTAPCCGGVPEGYVGTYYSNDFRTSWAECPTNSTLVNGQCQCNRGYQQDARAQSCVSAMLEPFAKNRCDAPAGGRFGQPVLPPTAEKHRSEVDFVDSGPAALTFGRTYRSGWGMDPLRLAGSMGKAWVHNHGAFLKLTPASAPETATVFTADGFARTFANGNRTASTKTLNGQSTSRSYSVVAGSNRIQGFTQTAGGTTTKRSPLDFVEVGLAAPLGVLLQRDCPRQTRSLPRLLPGRET